MTTAQAVAAGIPRWMALSHLEPDVEQICALVKLEYKTPAQRQQGLRYYLRCLRRDQWERNPRRQVKRPAALRPSKKASGYRTDSDAHRSTRLRLEPNRRAEIARKGGKTRWNEESFSRAS